MKQANVKVGRPYMLSLGRKGAVRVLVTAKRETGEFEIERNLIRATFSARRLSPVPVTDRDGNHIGSEV